MFFLNSAYSFKEQLSWVVEDLCSIIVGFSDIFSSKAGSRVPACTGAMQLIEPSSVDADLASWSFVRRSSSTLQLYQFVEVNFSSKTSAKPFCGIPIIQCFKKFYFSIMKKFVLVSRVKIEWREEINWLFIESSLGQLGAISWKMGRWYH